VRALKIMPSGIVTWVIHGRMAIGMRDRQVLLISALLLGATVSWRHGTYFTGSVDRVVVLKGVMSVAALMLARTTAHRAGVRRRLGTRSVWILALFLGASFFGGWSTGALFASTVLLVRVAILAATVFLMLRAYPAEHVVRSLVVMMAWFAGIAAVTGLPGLAGGGRLQGGLPPLNANEIAFLCGATVIAVVWRDLHGQAARWDAFLIIVFFGVIWITGSRTGLTALVLALIVMLVQVRRLPVPAFSALLVAVPIVVYLFGSGVVSGYLGRGGEGNVTTFSNRTIAWQAALHLHTGFWDQWFGNGLSMKKIPVTARWWDTQGLDSSWISALVQAGLVGVFILAAWSLINLLSASCSARPARLLWLSLLVFMLVRSVLESGLLDATPAFLLFFAVSVATEATSRRAATARSSPRPASPQPVTA